MHSLISTCNNILSKSKYLDCLLAKFLCFLYYNTNRSLYNPISNTNSQSK